MCIGFNLTYKFQPIINYFNIYTNNGFITKQTTEFKCGDPISNIIDFVIIAFLVFLTYRQLAKHGFVEDKIKPAEEKK